MPKIILLLLSMIFLEVAYAQEITTYAGGGAAGLGDGGPATAASIGYFAGMCVNTHGDVYIADGNNHRIRMIDSATQIITTVAGTGISGFYGDGGPATSSQLSNPTWIAEDSANNLYITDAVNNRIRKVDYATGTISTVAGNGSTGYSGDGGSATNASFNAMQGLVADKNGNLFVADAQNYRIRKINLVTGLISTYAGTGTPGFSGDGGPASVAKINGVYGICLDQEGNLYFADRSNSRVRKVGNNGIITTVAGNGTSSFAGDGFSATSAQVDAFAVVVDHANNLYIADYENNRIRKVNSSGIISTIAGTGVAGNAGDGGPATAAKINHPQGVSLDLCDNLLIADFNNKIVRKIAFNPDCLPISVQDVKANEAINITLHPNPATETLTIAAGVEIEAITIVNLIGQIVTSPRPSPREREVLLNVSHLPPGVYMVRVNEVWTGKFVKE